MEEFRAIKKKLWWIRRTYLPPIGEIAGNELKECILIEYDCEVYGELQT